MTTYAKHIILAGRFFGITIDSLVQTANRVKRPSLPFRGPFLLPFSHRLADDDRGISVSGRVTTGETGSILAPLYRRDGLTGQPKGKGEGGSSCLVSIRRELAPYVRRDAKTETHNHWDKGFCVSNFTTVIIRKETYHDHQYPHRDLQEAPGGIENP
jgi:hypothetical protein